MDDWYRFLGYAVVGAIAPFFWLAAKTVPLWIVKKIAPGLEWWLYSPIDGVIRRLGTNVLAALQRAYRALRAGFGR